MLRLMLILLPMSFLSSVNGSSMLLYYAIPNYFACRNDVYNTIANGNILPEQYKSITDAALDHSSRVLNSPTYDGFEQIIGTSLVKLRAEAETLHVNLKYDRHLYYLQEYIAKDYTRGQLALASVSLLKALKFNQLTLESFAKNDIKLVLGKKTLRDGFMLCRDEVHVRLSQLLRKEHKKELDKIEKEINRVAKNQMNIPLMKTSGNLGMYINGTTISSLTILFIVSIMPLLF